MRAEDLYKGRKPPTTQSPRQPSKQPDGKLPRVAGRHGIGDVKDGHLTGKGDPYSVAHKSGKK
jgi:hypothetical protein